MPNPDSYTLVDLDVDDAFVTWVDGTMHRTLPSVARGYVNASHYTDLNEQVLNAGTSITGWVANRSLGAAPPVLGGTTPESVKANILVYTDPVGSFYVNLPSDQTVGNYVEVAFEFQWNGGSGADFTPGGYIRGFVASAVDIGGTVNYTSPSFSPTLASDDPDVRHGNDFHHQVPDASVDPVWYTVRIPLYGLTSIRSVGVTQVTTPAAPGGVSAWAWMRNVRFREATGIDRAVYGSPSGTHIVIPTNYTTAKTQLPIFREQANITWSDRRVGSVHERRAKGSWHAHDFMLDHTGALDVGPDLEWIWGPSVMQPEDTFEFAPGGQYRIDTTVSLQAINDLKIRWNGAKVFATTERNNPFFHLYDGTRNISLYDPTIIGYSDHTHNGSLLTTVTGSPTVNGTGVEINALNEEVKLQAGSSTREFAYGRDKDEYYTWDITISATTPVANDVVVTAYEELNPSVVMHTETWTVTTTPTARQFRFQPTDDRARPKVHIKKATSSASTITIASVKTYRQIGYDVALEGNSGIATTDADGVYIENARIEGTKGDAFCAGQGLLTKNVVIRGMYSKANCRQGLSLNFNRGVDIQDLVIIQPARSAIDVEPYTSSWYCEDVLFKRVELFEPGINGVSAGNWGRIDRMHMEDFLITDCYARAFSGGGVASTFKNMTHIIRDASTATSGTAGQIFTDFIFKGQDVTLENIYADRGIQISATPDNDRTATARYPGGFRLNGWKVKRAGLYGGLVVEDGIEGLTVYNGPGENWNPVPVYGAGGVSHNAAGAVTGRLRHASGLHLGLHQNRLPNTYRGIAHTSVHMPGGFDLLDEPLHSVAGFGGSNTAVTLQASTARTTTGTTTGVDVGEATVVKLRLYCSAIAGTNPTLTVEVQQSHDNSTYATVDSFRTIRYSTSTEWCETIEVRNTARYLRLSYTIAGTGSPSFTFVVDGTSSVAANNLRGLAAAVTASASTHAVTFPVKTMPALSSFTAVSSSFVAGTLLSSTTYYYRMASRRLHGGPIVPLAQQSVTTSVGHTATDVRPFGVENIAAGYQIPAITVYRGTTSGGPYTHRLDVMPFVRFFTMPINGGQAFLDQGATATIYVDTGNSTRTTGGYPATVPWRTGSFTPVDETGYELDTAYDVWVSTNWNSGHPYITAKARSGFTINFPTAAPGDGSGRVSWELIR